MYTATDFINNYKLIHHPEGGYYTETYRAVESIAHDALPVRFSHARNFSTAIYFLLQEKDFSSFHRIQSDECWHFYAGGPLLIHMIHANGNLETVHLGPDILNGEKFQFVVPAQCWFASEPAPGSSFSFVGCTVSPGFDFDDFELANADDLSSQYPKHELLIRRLIK